MGKEFAIGRAYDKRTGYLGSGIIGLCRLYMPPHRCGWLVGVDSKVVPEPASRCSTSFELNEESSGTQRLIELLPLFFDMAALQDDSEPSGRVYLVDELDKNFHSALTIDLIKEYLQTCNARTRHQLIFTTHDLMLMDAECLRKDEMWFCEKGQDGEAKLKALSA